MPRRAVLQDQTVAYSSDDEFAVVPEGATRPGLASPVILDQIPSGRYSFLVARLRDGVTVSADTPSVTDVARATPAERCPHCKRRVNALHAEVRCGGDSRASCFAHECGAPIYEWVWENRGQKAYCRWHYDEHLRRQEAEERARIEEEESDRPRRRARRTPLPNVEETRASIESSMARLAETYAVPRPTTTLPTWTTADDTPPPQEEEHMPSLLNDERRDPPSSDRVLMNVHPDVRQRLRDLLASPEMRGVGYSAFINRACEVAEEQVRERADRPAPEIPNTFHRPHNGALQPAQWNMVMSIPSSSVVSDAAAVPTSRWTEEGIRQVITDRWGGVLTAPVRVVERSPLDVDVLLPIRALYSDEDWDYMQEVTRRELEPFRPLGGVVNLVRGRTEGEV